MKYWMILLMIVASGCTHYKPTKVVTSSEVVERTALGSPYTEETTESSTKVSTETEDDVDIHGNVVTEGKGQKNTTTVTRTRCLQEFNIVTNQSYDVEHKLRGRGLDIAGGAVLAVVGVGAIVAGLPSQDFAGNRRPAAYHMFAIGGLAIGGAAGLFAHTVIKGNKPAPPSERGLSEAVHTRQILEVDTCPGFGGQQFVAEPQSPTESESETIPQRLKRLDELHASGVLTEDEYKSRRAALVSQL